jgi:hypothetical protein
MASLNELISGGAVCRCLRSKELFYQSAAEASEARGPFWCVRTQSLLGPDGQIADAESCRPGRTCCETA